MGKLKGELMKKTKTLLISFIFVALSVMLLLMSLGGLLKSETASAATLEAHLDNKLHTATRMISINSDDPAITVLTPGLNCDASVWSNDPKNGQELAYNSASLIAQISTKLNNNLNLYYAKCSDVNDRKQFILYHLDLKDYSTNNRQTDRIEDASKHIVLLFESSIPSQSNQAVYEQFDYVLDKISEQYEELTGTLPRFNLIGHSRGGLTNIQYATEHPYNVASVYSMGTPYNGSVLSQIDSVMAFMGYAEKVGDEYIITNQGAKDIIDDNVAKTLRDNWNKAYTPSTNINVVAFGSMSTVKLIKKVANDYVIDPNADQKIKDAVQNYLLLIKLACNIIEANPRDTQIYVDNIEKIIDWLYEKLNYDVFKDFTGDIVDIEETKEILSLYNVINDEAVLMDDLFIDTNSQWGYGFNDGIDYNGFKRYVKVFDEDDLSSNRAQPTMPGLVHNLETMNSDYTETISASLVYGRSSAAYKSITDDTQGYLTMTDGRTLSFTPRTSGSRKITVNQATIFLYKLEDGRVSLLQSGTDSLTYTYAANTQYLIVLQSESLQVEYEFSIESNLQLGSNDVLLTAYTTSTFKLEVIESGYYVIYCPTNVKIKNTEATNYNSSYYYLYLKKGTNTIEIQNNSYERVVNINISKPTSHSANMQLTVSADKKIISFTNTNDKTTAYAISLQWTSGSNSVAIYNSNNVSLAVSNIVENNTATYLFNLSARETAYIIFQSTGTNVITSIYPTEQQFYWEVDGNLITSGDSCKIDMEIKTHIVRLVAMVNGSKISVITAYTINPADGHKQMEYSNETLTILANAEVTKDIVLVAHVVPSQTLRVELDDFITNITLNHQGGTSTTNSVSVKLNQKMKSVVIPKRVGYTFLGYYASNSVCYYNSSGTGTYWDRDCDSITLYARWQANVYTITYKNLTDSDENRTACNPNAVQYTYGVGTALNDPYFQLQYGETAGKWVFEGFYKESSFVREVSSISKTDINNFVLYAKWTKRLNGMGQSTSEDGFKVTDDGFDKNEKVRIYVGLTSTRISNLKSMLMTKLIIEVSFKFKEIDQGDQHIRLCYGDQILWTEKREDGSQSEFKNFSKEYIMSNLPQTDYLYLEFDASGAWGDDWIWNNLKITVKVTG